MTGQFFHGDYPYLHPHRQPDSVHIVAALMAGSGINRNLSHTQTLNSVIICVRLSLCSAARLAVYQKLTNVEVENVRFTSMSI